MATNTNWNQMNPSPGVYDWSVLDQWLNEAQQHGVSADEIVYTFIAVPRWASSNPNDTTCKIATGTCDPPKDLNSDGTGTNQHWKDFVTALTRHVAGRVHNWEVFNEPWVAGFFRGTPAQIVRMAKDLRSIARNYDANAKILSPAGSDLYVQVSGECFAAEKMQPYFTAGIGPYIDTVAFHAYIAVKGGSDNPENYVNEVGCIRQMLSKYNQQSKPLWATEGGWGRDTDLGNQDQQASFIARAYLMMSSLKVPRFYWYRWDNSEFGTLWDATNGIHKAGVAYRQVAAWLTGASLTSSCAGNSYGTWKCSFKLPNGATAMAAWNLKGGSTISVPTYYTEYKDVAGATHAISTKHTVSLTYKPVWIQ